MAKANGAGPYRPRRPGHTVLYRVLAQHFERFVQVYLERFAPTRGRLTQGAQEAVYRYLDCGISECRFARVRCGECGHDFFVAFSCKLRCMCPSCHANGEFLWAQWAVEHLLEDAIGATTPTSPAASAAALPLNALLPPATPPMFAPPAASPHRKNSYRFIFVFSRGLFTR